MTLSKVKSYNRFIYLFPIFSWDTSWYHGKKEGEEGGCFNRQNATRNQYFAFQNTSFCRWKILLSKVPSPNTLKSFLYRNIKKSYLKTSDKILISYHPIHEYSNNTTKLIMLNSPCPTNGCIKCCSPRHWDWTKFVIVLVFKASFNRNPYHSS